MFCHLLGTTHIGLPCFISNVNSILKKIKEEKENSEKVVEGAGRSFTSSLLKCDIDTRIHEGLQKLCIN